jgi:hypothetical protein
MTGQGELLETLSPGGRAVLAWSTKIHGKTGDRHDWGVKVAWLMHDHGPDAELPPFPSPRKTVRQAREHTARRLYREAQEPRPRKPPNPAYLPSRANATSIRDFWLGRFREHQQTCTQCAAFQLDDPAGLPHGRTARLDLFVTGAVCTAGSVPLWAAGDFQDGLRTGLYPERDQPAPAAQTPRETYIQAALPGLMEGGDAA